VFIEMMVSAGLAINYQLTGHIWSTYGEVRSFSATQPGAKAPKPGIASLEAYKLHFDITATHASMKPADPEVQHGLHNLIMFVSDHAISLASEPTTALRESNYHYRLMKMYTSSSHDSGHEVRGGLFKAVVLMQNEALKRIEASQSLILGTVLLCIATLVLQHKVLMYRLKALMLNHHGMERIVERLKMQATTAAAKRSDDHEDGHFDGDDDGDGVPLDHVGESESESNHESESEAESSEVTDESEDAYEHPEEEGALQ
jgi:hypothetical protein